MDVDKDFPKIKGVNEGLHQYYEIEQTTDDPFVGIPSAMNKPQTKHSKQNRHQKKQQKMAQKAAEKEGPRHIPPYSPVQRAEHPVPDLLTGNDTQRF